METLIGDALLTAACICYLPPMEQEKREQLLCDWKIVCQGRSEEDDDDDNDNDMTVTNDLLSCFKTDKSFPVRIRHVPWRNDFSLQEILSSNEELYTWRNSGMSANAQAVENALIIRAVCDLASKHWPLLVDTDLQSYAWLKCLHENRPDKGENFVNGNIFVLISEKT